jgi:adenosine deaminase
MTDILVTTLGISWQILPEILGFTNPDLVDLFKLHPEKNRMAEAAKTIGIVPARELWVVTTCGNKTKETLDKVAEWYDLLDPGQRPVLRIWQVDQTDGLSTEKECRLMCEGIHAIVYHAAERSRNKKLMLSLTGGRKTMSTDLQRAAAWFGCTAMIHVVEDSDHPGLASSRNWPVEIFSAPLSEESAGVFTPVVVGHFPPSPLLPVASSEYLHFDPLNVVFSDDSRPVRLLVDQGFPLVAWIEERQAEAGFLMSNYANTMLKGETVTNFLALYSLPAHQIKRLKMWRMGTDSDLEALELSYLKRLPKAELHCHLGGIADTTELVRIAGAVEEAVLFHKKMLEPWLSRLSPLVESADDQGIVALIGSLKSVRNAVENVPASICTAAFILLFRKNIPLLDRVIYGSFVDEKKFCGVKFKTYETLGDLQGSALLQNELCLSEACQVLAEKAIEHGVKYLEVRCSPANYSREGLRPKQVHSIITRAFAAYHPFLHCSLIFIASRHGDMAVVKEHVDLASAILEIETEETLVPLRGFDLAGDEKACSVKEMQLSLMPMMERCVHFTIHAGEDRPVAGIWEAVYLLNAERIGHGLTLKDDKRLKNRFRDRNIVLEMCPSSNFQIAGFRDNFFPQTADRPEYPLKEYLDQGLKVTVNTDNPGISRTGFTQELHRACRLTPHGLSMWEILSLLRNSFKAIFADRNLKQQLLKEAEAEVLTLLNNWLR